MRRWSTSTQTYMNRSNSSAPTSPQHPGEEMTHYTHSKHPLKHITMLELFTCRGCKEYGAGKRYACNQCEFQLHDFCALSQPLFNSHPLHPQHKLLFHSKPKPAKAGISWPRCDMCGKSTKGFTFRCTVCSFQMHPCCAMLSIQVHFPVLHPHPLNLRPQFTDDSNYCGECKKKRSSRMYKCTLCDYHLHAVCAKPLVNGLQASGIILPPDHDKPTVLGKAARLASQIVIDFVGGLVEGLGEGMGEALLQNVGKSNRRRAATTIREP